MSRFLKIFPKNLLSERIIWVVILTSIFWLGVGSYYCYPNAEDLSLAGLSRDKGIIGASLELLSTYDGRYFANIMHGINPLALGWYHGYKLMPLIGAGVLSLAIVFFLKSFSGNSISTFQIWSASLLVTSIHLATVPSLSHQLFVMICSFIYLYPWIFVLLWTGSLFRYIKSKKNIWFLLALFFLALSNGLNEMFLILNGALVGTVFILSFYNKKNRYISFLILLTYISCSLLFIFSPGIINRFNSFESDRHGVTFSTVLSTSAFYFVQTLKNWLVFHPSIILISLWAGLFLSRIPVINNLSFKTTLLISSGCISVAFLMTFAYYIPMSVNYYPERVYGSIQPLIIASLIILSSYFLSFIYTPKLTSIFIIAIVLSFFVVPNNYHKIYFEYRSGILKQYGEQMESNFELLTAASDNQCWEKVEIYDVEQLPKTITTPPYLSPNRTLPFWNHAYESYFQKDEVALEGDTINSVKVLTRK